MTISVLISAYNAEPYLFDCLNSIRTSNVFVEVLAYNDGSIDNTKDILQSFSFRNPLISYRYFSSKINKGKIYGYNLLFSHATGDIVCLLGADDIAPSYRFDLISSEFAGVDCIASTYTPFFSGYEYHNSSSVTSLPSKRDIFFRNVYHGGCLFLSFKTASSIFPLPSNLTSEDWYISYHLIVSTASIKLLTISTLFYRLHSNSDSGNCGSSSYSHWSHLLRRECAVLRCLLHVESRYDYRILLYTSLLLRLFLIRRSSLSLSFSVLLSILLLPFSIYPLRYTAKSLKLHFS